MKTKMSTKKNYLIFNDKLKNETSIKINLKRQLGKSDFKER